MKRRSYPERIRAALFLAIKRTAANLDGSDLRLPSDPTNDFSLIRNAEGQKQYNLAHLNAMFDLMSKVYVDATMQGKKGMNEHSALVSMIDRSNIPGKVIVLMDRGYESFLLD